MLSCKTIDNKRSLIITSSDLNNVSLLFLINNMEGNCEKWRKMEVKIELHIVVVYNLMCIDKSTIILNFTQLYAHIFSIIQPYNRSKHCKVIINRLI